MLLLLAGATLLATGCGKLGIFSNAGKTIVFRTMSNTDTRTAYETDYTGTTQPINWVSGDKIRIYSPEAQRPSSSEHWADYSVTPLSETKTKGELSGLNQNGLVWGTSPSYTFFSVYPAPSGSDDALIADGLAGKFTISIPQAQQPDPQMQYATMLSYASVEEDDTPVTLYFDPAFTAFEFHVKAESAVTLHKVELKSSANSVTGVATAQFNSTATGHKFTYTDEQTTPVSAIVTFPSGTTLSTGSALTFTVLALPVMQSNLTVCFTVSEGASGHQRTFSLDLKYANGTTYEFAARAKHKITGIITPKYTQLIQVNSQTVTVVDWDDSVGETEVPVH